MKNPVEPPPDSGELAKDLEREFSVANYLRLREETDFDSPYWFLHMMSASGPASMDYAFRLQVELEKFGIAIEQFLGMLDGDPEKIDRLCLQVLQAIAQRQDLEEKQPHSVASGKVIGDALIDFLICAVLETISYHGDFDVPHSYQVLVKSRLGLFNGKYVKEQMLDTHKHIAQSILAKNPDISLRELAKLLNVNPSTVSRWHSDPKFQELVELFRYNPVLPKQNTDS